MEWENSQRSVLYLQRRLRSIYVWTETDDQHHQSTNCTI